MKIMVSVFWCRGKLLDKNTSGDDNSTSTCARSICSHVRTMWLARIINSAIRLQKQGAGNGFK